MAAGVDGKHVRKAAIDEAAGSNAHTREYPAAVCAWQAWAISIAATQVDSIDATGETPGSKRDTCENLTVLGKLGKTT